MNPKELFASSVFLDTIQARIMLRVFWGDKNNYFSSFERSAKKDINIFNSVSNFLDQELQ